MATTNGYSLPGISDDDLQLIFDYRLPKAVQISNPFHHFTNDYQIADVRRMDQDRSDGHAVYVCIALTFEPFDGELTYYFRVNDGKERKPHNENPNRSS